MTSEFRAASLPSLSVRPVALAAALCAFSLLPTAASAQSSAASTTAAAASLPSVVITATRTPVRADQTEADVTVLTRDDLERASGRTLSEVLSQQGGIQLSSNGGLGKTSSVFIRGLEARHVLLLVDGVRYGSATTGMPELDNLPLGDIDRIEIVRGPLSSLYGSDAVGGVVQVFTRRASASEGTRYNGSVTAGTRRYGQASAGTSFNDGQWSGALQLLHTENGGFSATSPRAEFGNYNADPDGFRQNAASAHVGLKLSQGWQVGAHLLSADALSAYDDGPGADAKSGLRTRVLSVDTSGEVTSGWRTQLRLARSANDYETIASASPYADLGTIATVQQQLSWDNTVSLPVGTLLVVAEHLKQKVTKPAGNYDTTNRTINSLALGYNATIGIHTVQASLRHDRNSQYGNPTTGTVGYGLALMEGLRATAQIGTSFVAPSFNQLYWPSYGNPKLEPEKGKHAEVGLRYTTGEQQFSATVFGNRIRGYITQGANPVNLPYAQSNGVSLGYDGQLGPVKIGAAVDHLTPKNDTDGSANQGNLLPRRARNAAKLSADVDLGAWTVGAGLQAYSHRFNDTANKQRLAGYATVDLHAQWQYAPDWAVGARLNNVANRPYETALGYNQPGRELYVTMRYTPR